MLHHFEHSRLFVTEDVLLLLRQAGLASDVIASAKHGFLCTDEKRIEEINEACEQLIKQLTNRYAAAR